MISAIRNRFGVELLGIAFAFLIGAVIYSTLSATRSPADPNDNRQVAQGKSVYDRQCASCHGTRLEGQPNWQQKLPDGRMPAPPHDASGHTWHHPDSMLFGMIEQGIVPGKYAPRDYRGDMPAFATVLSEAEIWAVIAFIKSSWPPQIRAAQDKLTRERDRH